MRTIILLLSAALAIGCKDKPKTQPQPQPKVGSGAAGSAGSAGATGSGSAAPTPNEIVLPTSTGTPPVKTTKPVTPEQLEKLSTIEFGGFGRDVRVLQPKALEVRYLTSARPKIAVTMTVTPCFDCVPMDLEKYKPMTDAMKLLLAPELRKLPDTLFELGATELAGQPVIFTYQLGYLFGPDESGQQVGAYSNAYVLYYNDGVSSIRVVAEYKDDPTATREDMVNLVPREDLEKIAKAFLDTYTHAWN